MKFKLSGITKLVVLLIQAIIVIAGSACKKYLDKKSIQSTIVPSNLNDLQALLDNQNGNIAPGYLELVADNYYILSSSWNASGNVDQRLNYIWDKSARISIDNYIWSKPYTAIYEANLVLDLLPKIDAKAEGIAYYNSIKGTALFYRGFQFYQVAQLFCKPYSNTSLSDDGIVIRLNSNVTERYNRVSVQETYNQIIADLKGAAELLPVNTAYKTRPNKAAVFGMLARVYLSMREYNEASLYVDSAIRQKDSLLDYNLLTPSGNPALPENYISNPEVIFFSFGGVDLIGPSVGIIDSTLYKSYDINDLRKKVFFGSSPANPNYWKGSYYGTSYFSTMFSGITTDELYLIRAELFARAGNVKAAMKDLNDLLRKRWKSGTYTDLMASDASDALAKVLVERRKELVFRGLRWTDLRRLNLDGANISLKRIINGTEFSLPPNDQRWVLPIPEIEINRSGISQNPR